MKVWITKYVLARGIFEIDVNRLSDDGETGYGETWLDVYRGEGREWHRTKEYAIKKAKEIRQRKIENLKKQIKKLEEMKFE